MFPVWLWLPILLQTVLAAVLCFVPLFDLLAYEFCFASTLLCAVTAPIIGLGVGSREDQPTRALSAAMGLALVHLAPGLLLISLNAQRVRNCNYSDGMLFFLLLPCLSSLYGATLGVLIGRLFVGAKAAMRALVTAVAVLLPLGLSLYALYTQPPIFAFDHLWGYFAGSLYDESIAIDARLWTFRGATLLRILAMGALVMAWERWARLGTALVVTVLALGVGGVATYEHVLGPRLGFRVSREDLARALPIAIERPGLVVHLPPGIEAAKQAAIADDHAFRLQALLQRLDVTLTQPIHSWVYADANQKAQLMGGRGTMVAKPWLHEIHVHNPEAPHPVVPHELAHAVAAEFGSELLRVSAQHEILVNMGLVEGFAQAFTPDSEDLDLHHWARAMRELKLAPDMRSILGPAGFWTQAPRRAYTVAGSFVRYLLEAYGAAPLKAAYATGNFAAAYDKPLDSLVTGWETFLAGLTVTPREQHIAAERFRTPSIFARPCAHEIAQLSAAAERADPQTAVKLRKEICEHLGNSPAARLELSQSLRGAGDLDGFLGIANELLSSHELNAVQEAELLETKSEVLWDQGRLSDSQAAARAVLDLQISAAAERLAWVRLWAMDLKPEVGNPLLRYFGGRLAPVPAVLLLDREGTNNPGERTFPYLVARQLHRSDSCEQALEYLHAAGPHPFLAIETERLRLVADCLWRLGRLDEALAAYNAYEQHAATSGEAAVARDWAARIAWKKGQQRPKS